MRAAGGFLLVVIGGLMFCGCRDHREQQPCRMNNEAVIDHTDGAPGEIVVAAAGVGRYVIAWSADGETRFAAVNSEGERTDPVSRVERLESPGAVNKGAVDGGPKTFWPAEEGMSFDAEDLALEGMDDGSGFLAILERPRDGRAGGVYLAMLSPTGGGTRVRRLGPAGLYASRISLTLMNGKPLVAWHEGDPSGSSVKTALIDPASLEVVRVGDVDDDGAIAGPAVASGPGGAILVWSRTIHDGPVPRSQIRAAALGADLKTGPAVTVAETLHLDPSPRLASLSGEYGLVYRDDEDEDMRAEYYFCRLGPKGERLLEPVRISRADGFRTPALSRSGPHHFAAVIRSFQHNLLVGLNRFDDRGRKVSGEFQIYADKSDFTRVALVAHGEEALIVYGEDRHGSGRILTGKVVCQER